MRKRRGLSSRNARRSSRAPDALETTRLGKSYGGVNAVSALISRSQEVASMACLVPMVGKRHAVAHGRPRHTEPRQFRLPDKTDAMGVHLAAPGAIAMMFWTALLAFGVVMALRAPDLSDRSRRDAGGFVHPV
jgi:hypothetical protein